MKARVLHLDFETFAHRNLRAVGAWEYVADPNFEVSVIGWAFDDGPVVSEKWPRTKTLPLPIEDHLRKGGEVHAWNANFEYVVLTRHYGWALAYSKLVCTMQRALAFGLPASLEDAGRALGLSIVKDTSARSLMMRMGKPKKDGGAWHRTDPAKLAALEAYCRRDVEAEREVGKHVPRLSSFEKKLSEIDAQSNEVGIRLDDVAVRTLMSAREVIRRDQKTEVTRLTGGAVTRVESEVARLQAWLVGQGVDLPSVNKEAVSGALKGSLPGPVRRVLELRQEASKSSLGKLDRMLAVQGSDERVRGQLQYYGAGRTGRWAGRLIQIQNLPRNPGKVDVDAVLGVILHDRHGLGLFYERPLEALSACLRGCLTASRGKLLAMIDLAQIEARVLAWLAGQTNVVEAFRRGEDLYTTTAAKVGSSDRQLGKVLVLACGFQIGAVRFRKTAQDQYGVTMTAAEAEWRLDEWRRDNPAIVGFWHAMDKAARAAIAKPGRIETVGKCRMRVKGGRLLIEKPGGGVLVYHNPRMEAGDIVFDGVGQTNKQWGTQKTYGGRLVENVTQSVARDIVAEAVVAIEWRWGGKVPVMTVHDELVYEVSGESEATGLKTYVDAPVPWAAGLPLASKLTVGFRYGK